MFQHAIARVRGFVSGNQHEPKAFSQFVLVPTHNFAQTPPNTVANDGASDPA
jgi:hypothetical protein